MITVQVGEAKVVLVPRSLQNFIEKVDYIKSRRPSPYAALDGCENMSADGKKTMIDHAMKAFMQLSSVGFDEEIAFDVSYEGFYFSLWQGAKASIPGWGKLKPHAGVATAKTWFTALTPETAEEVRFALKGIDQRGLSKNSDGRQKTQEDRLAASPSVSQE